MRDINKLHPDVKILANKLVKECAKQGLKVKITDTLRTKKEQDDLYAQGRTKPGNIVTYSEYPDSYHCWGIAFDVCQNIKGKEFDESTGFFDKVGKIGQSLGLEWGGSWTTFRDRPHFQLPRYGTIYQLKSKYKTPENFMSKWHQTIEEEEEEEVEIISRNYEYNGKITAAPVINHEGKNYIEVRTLSEILNKNVQYDANTKITSLKDNFENKEITVNNTPNKFKTILINNSTFVELRNFADKLGYSVDYDPETRSIALKIKDTIVSKFKGLFKK